MKKEIKDEFSEIDKIIEENQKTTLDKILEEFDREFAINKGRKWILTKEEAKELKSFISQKFPEYAKEIVGKEFEAGEKSMARGVLRRIKSGRNLGHIELLCKAVLGINPSAKKELKI